MPITPFHFGPGALFKAAAPSRVSWSVFALSNVLIDLEPISLFFIIGDPAHPWLHTLPGALGVAIVAATLGRRPCEWALRLWNSRLSPAQSRWLGVESRVSRGAAWAGALLGTLSHLALDAVMHVDVHPLWPLVKGNPWQGVVSVEALQWGCVAAGVLGLVVLAAFRQRR